MRWLLLTVAALLVVGMGAAARAEDADTRAARALVAKGSQLFEEKRYAAAAAAFEEAYQRKPHHVVQCNIARCYEMQGDYAEAAHRYRRCLSEGGDKTPAAAQIRSALAEVERKVPPDAMPPQPPPPPPTTAEPAPVARPFFVLVALGPAVKLDQVPVQLKLAPAFGYHFSKTAEGPALAVEVQSSFGSDFFTIEVGPKFVWDIALSRKHGLYLAPSGMVGFAHLTERCQAKAAACESARSGATIQLGIEAKLLLADRVLIGLRPLTIDLLPTKNSDWELGVRYDLMLCGGAIF